jgi:ribonuclease BN (tRNA processing enzyme)
MSNITILGAYGAKSDKGGSSAFLLHREHVLDAGNLLRPLREKSAYIETIWLTHSHLDHISDIAYILDNYYEKRRKTLKLCGLPKTIETLKKHFFNNEIWPDFSKIPLHNGDGMSLAYEDVEIGKEYNMEGNSTIEPFLTDHTVASCGYIILKNEKRLLISADTYSLETVIQAVQEHQGLETLVLECSFPSGMEALAKASKHLTAKLLFSRLAALEGKGLKLYINHLKPSYEDVISQEIEDYKGTWDVTILKDGDKIYF